MMRKREFDTSESSRQRRRLNPRPSMYKLPTDVAKHVNTFLGEEDTKLEQVSKYLNTTVDPKQCVKKTQFGLKCLKNLTFLQLNEECHTFCNAHFPRVAESFFDMVTRPIRVNGQEFTFAFLSAHRSKPFTQDSQIWNCRYTQNLYFGRQMSLNNYINGNYYNFDPTRITLGKYLIRNKWVYKNAYFKVTYLTQKPTGIREIENVTGTWENDMEFIFNSANFQIKEMTMDDGTWGITDDAVDFEFQMEEKNEDSEEDEDLDEDSEDEEKDEEKEEKKINCLKETKGIACSGIIDLPHGCFEFCNNAATIATQLKNAIKLLLEKDLFVETSQRSTFKLSNNWTCFILGQDDDDVILEASDTRTILNTIMGDTEWQRIRIGFPKSEMQEETRNLGQRLATMSRKKLQDIRKVYVELNEEVLELQSWYEDEDFIIFEIQNSFNIDTIMNDLD